MECWSFLLSLLLKYLFGLENDGNVIKYCMLVILQHIIIIYGALIFVVLVDMSIHEFRIQ
jgi:hypothetical protein